MAVETCSSFETSKKILGHGNLYMNHSKVRLGVQSSELERVELGEFLRRESAVHRATPTTQHSYTGNKGARTHTAESAWQG